MLDILVAVSPRQSLSWIEWISTLIWRMAAVGFTNMKRRVLWVLRIEVSFPACQTPCLSNEHTTDTVKQRAVSQIYRSATRSPD